MNPGKLNRHISFIEIKNGKNEDGTPTKVKEELFRAHCQVKTQSMKEVESTIGTELENTVTFIVRYQLPFSIDTEMLIKYKNIEYEIKQLLPDEDFQRDIKIIAKKVT